MYSRVAGLSFLVAGLAWTGALSFGGVHEFTDLTVYRSAGEVMLAGGDVYGKLPDTGLPFTYPPFAAMVFVLLTFLPSSMAAMIFTAVSLGLCGLALGAVLSLLRPQWSAAACLVAGAAVNVAALVLEPFRLTLALGQINLVLMAAIVLDCLVKDPPWPRGVLIGVAAAIKLTPIAFLLFFLLRRDWRAAAYAAGTAAAVTVITFFAVPSASARYWLHLIVDPSRIGAPEFAGNQSLRGVLLRALPDFADVLWVVLGLAVLAAAVVIMQWFVRRNALVAALLVNAVAILVISPVSWSHHWVWIVPALVLGADVAARYFDRGQLWVAGAAAGVIALQLWYNGPHWRVPFDAGRERDWGWRQQLIGNAYVLVALALLVIGAVYCWRRRESEPTVDIPVAAAPARSPVKV